MTNHPLHGDPDREENALSESAHVYATKLGGYPSGLQHAVQWLHDDFAYVLQIDSEAKVGLSWAHHGIVYVARRQGPQLLGGLVPILLRISK